MGNFTPPLTQIIDSDNISCSIALALCIFSHDAEKPKIYDTIFPHSPVNIIYNNRLVSSQL